MQRAGQTLDRVGRLFGVVRRQHRARRSIQALDREWPPKLAAAEDAIAFNPGLFKRIEAVYRSLASSTLTPEQKRLVERTYDSFVRRGARLDAAQKAQLSEINQELAALFSEFSTKVLADENTWIVLEHEADLAGLPASLVVGREGRRRRAQAGRQVGDRQHPLERRSVPDLLDAPRPAREGLEEVQEPRRQRRRQRHQRDHREDRQAARRAREAARLRDPRALAHVRHHGRGPEGGAGADDAGLAGGRRRA